MGQFILENGTMLIYGLDMKDTSSDKDPMLYAMGGGRVIDVMLLGFDGSERYHVHYKAPGSSMLPRSPRRRPGPPSTPWPLPAPTRAP